MLGAAAVLHRMLPEGQQDEKWALRVADRTIDVRTSPGATWVGAKFAYVLDPQRPEGRTWDNAGRVEDVATGSAAGPAAGRFQAETAWHNR